MQKITPPSRSVFSFQASALRPGLFGIALLGAAWLAGCGGASASGVEPMGSDEPLSKSDEKSKADESEADEEQAKADTDASNDVIDSSDVAPAEASERGDMLPLGDEEQATDEEPSEKETPESDGLTTRGTIDELEEEPQEPELIVEDIAIEDVPDPDEISVAEDPSDGDAVDSDQGDQEEVQLASWLTSDKEDSDLEIVDDLSVLVIFDNSGSMDTYWDGESRWAVANRALYDAIAPVRTSLTVGAIRFPTDDQCGVSEFEGGSQFGFSLAGDFLDRWASESAPPFGSTPLGQAFIAADAAIADASERELLAGRFNVIVVTDGEPNCESDPALLTALPAKWAERGVLTHVLGLPGSTQAAQLLNDIAEAGGTEHFQQLGTVDELREDLVVATR